MTEPTDAEIWQMWMPMVRRMGVADPVEFARAVLAKWGQPARSGEPVECDCRNPYSHDECTQQAGCKIKTKLSRKTHQPVEREPLTDEQMYEERHTAGPQLLELAKLWADNRIHVYQFVNEAEKIVTAVARRVERAHGIKGGQHGTE